MAKVTHFFPFFAKAMISSPRLCDEHSPGELVTGERLPSWLYAQVHRIPRRSVASGVTDSPRQLRDVGIPKRRWPKFPLDGAFIRRNFQKWSKTHR